MATSVLYGDMYVSGNLTSKSYTPVAGSITDDAIESAAGIQASKLEHRHEITYAQDSTTDATVERKVMHVVYGTTGTLIKFRVGSVSVASGGGNAVVDLLKNGVSVLSATITLDGTNTAYVPEDASGYTSTSLVAGDVLEFKLTSAAATKPKGVFAQLILDEDAQ